MQSFRSLLLVAASGAAVLAGTAMPAMAQTSSAAAQPSAPWAQVASDVPADTAVRFGTLPNGMRYALLRNATPPGQASLRLRIDAGSLMENEDQLGLAHFTEHMAFNGTTNIPENELLRVLERLGLAFGADTNAATSFDQTFYQLELPRTNDETVDTSLRILREQVSEALFEAEDVEAERGVIVGEERTRNSPQMRALKAQLQLLAPGQRIANRLPIGDLEVIRTAPRQRFVDFYNAYYRPSRATLVAVGDFDVDAMEAKIRTTFGDWQARAADGPEPDLGTVAQREPETTVLVEPGTQSSVQLNWIRPPDTRPDTAAKRISTVHRNLGLAVLNRRLVEISRQDDPPFVGAGAQVEELFDSLERGILFAAFNPGGLNRAMETIEQEQRRLTQFGLTQAELDREIANGRTARENAVAAAATRVTPALSDALLDAVNEDRVFATPQTNLDLFNRAVEGLTPDVVLAATRAVFEGGGPLAQVITPAPIDGGEAAVTAALEASRQVPVTAREAVAELEWPYATFGAPSTPTDRREYAEIGTTVVTFPNGVRLTVKPTDFRDEQILVSARTGIGELALPTDRTSSISIAPIVFVEGGLGKLTADEVNRVLTGRIQSAGFQTVEDSFQLSGATRPQDLDLQMQVLTAYLTDPGLRPAPFEQIKTLFPQILAQQMATPEGAFGLLSGEYLYVGDKRQSLPTAEEIAGWTNEEMKTGVIEGLSAGPIDIVVVGDVTVDAAVAAVASTFGALPARSAAPSPLPGSDVRRFPAGTPQPVAMTHNGPADQALGFVAWPTVDAVEDFTEARLVSVLASVLELRVLEEIRERQALAYSPVVGASSSTTFEGYGSIGVTAQTGPDGLSPFFQTIDTLAEGLRDTPITEDELNRARLPVIERIRRDQAGNAYWLGELSHLAQDPTELEQITTHLSDLERITPADVQAAARRYLVAGKAWRAQVVSATPGGTSAATSTGE